MRGIYSSSAQTLADGQQTQFLLDSAGRLVTTGGATMAGLTNASIASLSGASEQLLAQGTSRGALLIQNIGDANIGIRFVPLGGDRTAYPAAIGTAATLTLYPGDTYEPGRFVPINAIEVIGTSTKSVTCYYST